MRSLRPSRQERTNQVTKVFTWRERLSLPKSEIWHAGFGFKYDIVPATELGYTTVWVNRQGEARPVNVKETFLVGDMQTLVYLMQGIEVSMRE